MPLTDLQRVRSLIGDMNKVSINELVAKGNGSTVDFQLDMYPVRTGSLVFLVTGNSKTGSATVNHAVGMVSLTASAPPAGDQVVATYLYNSLSDDEIQSIIDTISGTLGDNLLLAASLGCYAIAANNAKFFAYTQGEKSVDKNQQSKKLLDLADSYMKAFQASITTVGTNVTVMTFHDSGTAFDGYDTASANIQEDL